MRTVRGSLLLPSMLLASVLLAGCTVVPALEVPEAVTLQVPVPCIAPAARPQKPVTRTESDLMAMDRYRRTLAAWSDLKRLEAYAAELEALLEACSRIAPASAPAPPNTSPP